MTADANTNVGMAGAAILSDVVCKLGEGPSYDPLSDTLFWFDITGSKLLGKRLTDGETTVHELPWMASAVAVVDPDRQLLVADTGLFLRDVRSGALSLHKEIEADNPATRSNDSRVHQSGAVWIGTMGRNAELGAGAFYWYRAGELRTLYTGAHIPNSICFSPAGDMAYFTGLERNLLMCVPTDPATGLPAGEPRLLTDRRGSGGALDGSVCDADGVIWNACWDAGRVDAYAPDGRHLRSVPVPASRSTCPAFVGREADRLAVTSASSGLDAEALLRDPHAGKTFLLDLPVRGRHEPRALL